MHAASFEELGLRPELLRAVEEAGYTIPTPIQVQAIHPPVFAFDDFYRTPLNVFRGDEDHFVIALTYGPGADWVRNIVAAGRGTAQPMRASPSHSALRRPW